MPISSRSVLETPCFQVSHPIVQMNAKSPDHAFLVPYIKNVAIQKSQMPFHPTAAAALARFTESSASTALRLSRVKICV